MHQFQVLKQITTVLGRMLETHAGQALGEPVRIRYGFEDGLRKKPSFTVLHTGLETRKGDRDREYEFTGGGEQFRSPPLLLRSHYLISAWATPPEDQLLLGAALQTFLDHPFLELQGVEEEEAIAYAGIPGIDLEPLTLEKHHALAQMFSMPLAPSMGYWVDFRVRSGKVSPIKRVKERIIDYRKIDS